MLSRVIYGKKRLRNKLKLENKLHQEFYSIGFKKTWCNGENFNNQPMFSNNQPNHIYLKTDHDFHIYHRIYIYIYILPLNPNFVELFRDEPSV